MMCFSSPPTPHPTPALPTFEEAASDEDIQARDKTRARLKGAMNTRASMLSEQSASSGKTFLGI